VALVSRTAAGSFKVENGYDNPAVWTWGISDASDRA